jgi:nickel/cobalt transporter (NiCoT) family protein
MSLLDTLDGAFMNFAYGWALSDPSRKAAYNRTVTGLSVAVALGIGAIQLLSVVGEDIDVRYAGYAIAALFAATWVVALAVARVRSVA